MTGRTTMARSKKEEEYTTRRNDILDAAQYLVQTKGYEQTSIQDILDRLHISKGAFYHYFGSKAALLEAVITRSIDEAELVMLPIVRDPALPALEKFNHLYDVMGRWKTARRPMLMAILRVWYADDNAVMRQKTVAALIHRVEPLFVEIVRQGNQEGVFKTTYPERVGGVIISLIQSFGDELIQRLLAADKQSDDLERLIDIVLAYNEALERVLGASPGSIHVVEKDILAAWLAPEDENEITI